MTDTVSRIIGILMLIVAVIIVVTLTTQQYDFSHRSRVKVRSSDVYREREYNSLESLVTTTTTYTTTYPSDTETSIEYSFMEGCMSYTGFSTTTGYSCDGTGRSYYNW